MRSNPLLRIPGHAYFKIPQYLDDDAKKSYLKQLTLRFTKISNYLNNAHVDDFRPSLKEDIISRIEGFQQAMLTCIAEYMDGSPAAAYDSFTQILDHFDVEDQIKTEHQVKIEAGTPFFRIQKEYEKIDPKKSGKEGMMDQKKPLDLFHPPFQRRRSVGTNRFSISGYPCLYLSENIHTSYSECFPKEKKVGAFHGISFKNHRPLYFMDLSNSKLSMIDDDELFPGIEPDIDKKTHSVNMAVFTQDLVIFQLILACHTKVAYQEGYPTYFKAEYIIPQLLLQWLRQKGYGIDGIRYRSCTGVNRFPEIQEQYNYVLPVVSGDLEKGFCPWLLPLFSSTSVYSYLNDGVPKKPKTFLKKISNALISSLYKPLSNNSNV